MSYNRSPDHKTHSLSTNHPRSTQSVHPQQSNRTNFPQKYLKNIDSIVHVDKTTDNMRINNNINTDNVIVRNTDNVIVRNSNNR